MRTVAVDWSGALRCSGKIWVAVSDDGCLVSLDCATDRADAIERVIATATAPAIVGLDFSFSFPRWFLEERQLASAASLWALAAADGETWLSGCEPPFWGRPGKPRPSSKAHFRRTELAVGSTGGITPKSSFQIGGAGAVGTGTVRGLPFLTQLQSAGFAIWPFDAATEWTVVEIYPRLFTGPVVKSSARARAMHLRDLPMPNGLKTRAASCEDAFDAAVSSVTMFTHVPAFRGPAVADDTARLEGTIWAPGA